MDGSREVDECASSRIQKDDICAEKLDVHQK